ncbi:hypothetical protein, partial [Klebsiella pneumoniae]|uniref:hypothetical protein n=1 Tax=Klebsiella pneumoniae TaxID=573 RepID=UPI002731E4D2
LIKGNAGQICSDGPDPICGNPAALRHVFRRIVIRQITLGQMLIHAKNANMPALYDAVIAAGAKPFGMYALNSLRIEKGYRAWKGDLSTDY